MKNKFLGLSIVAAWTISIGIGVYSIFSATPLNVIKSPTILTNLLQRVTGIVAFILLFYQILFGAFMPYLAEKTGGIIYKIHIYQGVLIYTLILAHPVFFLLFNHFAGRGVDPYYVFSQVCFICQSKGEAYYTFGRISFWLINITVFAGLFRTINHFMRVNWKKFHLLNYPVFVLVGIHGYFVGSDFSTQPFFGMAILFSLVFMFVLIKKAPELFADFMKWLKRVDRVPVT